MANEKTHCIIFKNQVESVRHLPAELAAEVLIALADYHFTGKMPTDMSPVCQALIQSFSISVEKTIAKSKANRENGANGGRGHKKTQSECEQEESQSKLTESELKPSESESKPTEPNTKPIKGEVNFTKKTMTKGKVNNQPDARARGEPKKSKLLFTHLAGFGQGFEDLLRENPDMEVHNQISNLLAEKLTDREIRCLTLAAYRHVCSKWYHIRDATNPEFYLRKVLDEARNKK